MTYTNKELLDRINPVVSVMPCQYVDALLLLHKKISADIKWVISGNLAECLQTVQVEPNNIEIVTSKQYAEKIFEAMAEFKPQPIALQTYILPRNSLLDGEESPVYAKSYYFEFKIAEVKVIVHGDLQFKVGNWDWGDTFDFEPSYVYVVGKKTAVTPLVVAAQLYQSLGWTDRLEKIQQVIERRNHQINRNP